jgi:hypothetical protein
MKISRLLPLAAAISLMFGCGGGSSSLVGGSGKIVDGYVRDAVVVCDTNNNGVKDGAEVSTTTNATGDFTFTPACTAPIFSTGGVNVDTGLAFVGVLKAPAGSTMVTPLTTLVASGMTNEQVVTALGLPAGTNVTTADPIAAGNEDLRKKTLVVQQIMQKTTETLAKLAGDESTSTQQSIFQDVATAVATTIKAAVVAAPNTAVLVGAGNVVNDTLVKNSVSASVTAVSVSSSVPAAVKNDIALLNATNVATVASTAITTQAEQIAQATDVASIVAQAKIQQEDTSVATSVNTIESLLTNAVAGTGAAAETLTNQLVAIATVLETALTDQAQAAGDIVAAINAAEISAGVTVPDPVTAPTNYLTVTADQITVGGVTATLSAFANPGVTVAGNNLNTVLNVSFAFGITGTVAPAVTPNTVKVAAEVKANTGSRLIQVMIDKVDLTQSGQVLTATIPAGAQAQIYAVTSAGATTSITLNNLAANSVTVANNTVSLNLGTLLSDARASMSTAQQAIIDAALLATGTFSAKVAFDGVDVRTASNTTLLDPVSVISTGNTAINVVGRGAIGVVTRP